MDACWKFRFDEEVHAWRTRKHDAGRHGGSHELSRRNTSEILLLHCCGCLMPCRVTVSRSFGSEEERGVECEAHSV